MQIEKQETVSVKNIKLAHFYGYDLEKVNEQYYILFNGRIGSEWMPNIDMNQIFLIKNKLQQLGYKFYLVDNKCEISKDSKIINVSDSRRLETSLFECIYKTVNEITNENSN